MVWSESDSLLPRFLDFVFLWRVGIMNFSGKWQKIEEYFAMIGVAVATILAFIAVVLRYLFGYSHSGMEEIMRYAVVWSIVIGGAVAIRRHRHVQVDILISSLSPKGKAISQGVAFLLGAGLCFLLMFKGIELVLHSVAIKQVSQSALQIPMAIPQSAVPVGAFLMAVRFLQQAFHLLSFRDSKREG